MRDIVIIPTYDRPEYLAVCLEKLFWTRGIREKDVWICRDSHADDPRDAETLHQTIQVVVEAMAKYSAADFRLFHRPPHTTYGNSFNVLEAFREAYDTDARYVYLLEDDVMVMPDYFEWHEQAQKMWRPFVSCAGRINRSLNFAMNGPEAIDETNNGSLACVSSSSAYGSWAACFPRESLFFASSWARQGNCWCPGNEQDICIQSLMIQKKEFSVWPYVPRAYHMGWYSYHRTAGMRFNGTLDEKIAALRVAISDPQKIRTMACLQEIDPYPTAPVDTWQGSLFLKADYRKKA